MHVTDLVWIKHILADLDLTEAQRDSWAARINRDQDAATGLFRYPPEADRIDAHATWQAVAALNMMGRRPAHRLACLAPLLTVSGFRAWCDAYDPLTSHHRFMLAVIAAGSMPPDQEWRDVFGQWYDRQQDRQTGFPCPARRPSALSPAFLLTVMRFALCGSVPRPDRIVQTVLAFQNRSGSFSEADLPGYMEMDAAFLLHLLSDCAEAHQAAIDRSLERLSRFIDGVLADAQRRGRLLADPHRALAVCGNLSVLWRHFGQRDDRAAPFPWAELVHFCAPL